MDGSLTGVRCRAPTVLKRLIGGWVLYNLLQQTKTQVEFESREALLAERRESEEHCKLLLIAQREKSQREEESRWEAV